MIEAEANKRAADIHAGALLSYAKPEAVGMCSARLHQIVTALNRARMKRCSKMPSPPAAFSHA